MAVCLRGLDRPADHRALTRDQIWESTGPRARLNRVRGDSVSPDLRLICLLTYNVLPCVPAQIKQLSCKRWTEFPACRFLHDQHNVSSGSTMHPKCRSYGSDKAHEYVKFESNISYPSLFKVDEVQSMTAARNCLANRVCAGP